MNIATTPQLLITTVLLCMLSIPSIASTETPPLPSNTTLTYQEPDINTGNHEIRRREGGLAEGEDGSTVRGAVRGATRGAVRGAVRGATRGAVRGVVRGVTRGAVRGVVRGVTRGAVRGVARGAIRGPSSEDEPALMPVPSRLVVLAPMRTGLTSTSQPTLYWFISAEWNEPLEFTLIQQGIADPIARFSIAPPSHSGSYPIDLASHHVHLQPNVEYEWFVNIILDPVERSGDLFGSGTIVYQPLAPAPNVPPSVHFLAEHGYWYDMIDTLTKSPNHNHTQAITASLLHQQHLPLAAKWFSQQAQSSL